jgi:two-component system cell cycle response regulator
MSASILVIDDNPLNLKLACEVLALAGFTVCTAEDAEQALALLDAGPLPDLILADIALPGMDGLSFTRQVKADPRTAHIPVVALTAYAMKGDDRKALDAGCAAYITKPVDTRRLPQQVRELLAAGEAARRKVKILVVEDDRIDLKLMSTVLEVSGHMVLSGSSAEDAAATVTSSPPDVILLDLRLPGMDGLAFLRQLKADPRTAGIPVVTVTAWHDAYRRDELLAAGCDAYLVKPVSTRELARQLEQAARRKAR